MNKAITDGLVLMPPPFANGLGVWSSGNGTPGSATYNGAPNAAYVPADQDFAGCLELVKTVATQQLRHMGETPILPGCYLRITARVKALSGNLPTVRIAGWAGGAGGVAVTGLVTTGPAVTLTSYGQVVTVSAIVGTGARTGVDMPWGTQALYGHFGLDMTGPNGGVVRIDDIVIEDITSAFLRNLMDWVDVRDYGAKGDGVTNDYAAFEAADVAAAGREVLVPAGDFYIGTSLTIDSPARFQGKLIMPDTARLVLAQNFNLLSYIDAFGGDEMQGFRKAIQALLNFSDHDSLDMGGRTVNVTAPINVQVAVNNRTEFSTRRVIRNGALYVVDDPAWNDVVVTSQASYSPTNALELTGVANIANVPVGALVVGTGVGREIYVKAKNVGAGTLTLSKPLYGGTGTQVFTFKRFQHVLDFSGFNNLDKLVLQEVEIQCNGKASAILLPPDGSANFLADCHIIRPKDRGITSHGRGCSGMQIDRCNFLSNEQSIPVQNRTSIAFNSNHNDVKVRDCRAMRFAHFGVMGGANHMIANNHFFNGDDVPDGVRRGGLVLTEVTNKVTITGNYIDNCFIELTNEHEANPAWTNGFTFGAVSITSNTFLAIDVASWFSFIVVKPYGPGHFIDGLVVTGNMFHAIAGNIGRADTVDTSFASLDMTKARNITFLGNTFHNVVARVSNPASATFTQNTAQTAWTCDFGPLLPFGGRTRAVESITSEGIITTSGGSRITEMPYAVLEQGGAGAQVQVNWSNSAKGKVRVVARMDATI